MGDGRLEQAQEPASTLAPHANPARNGPETHRLFQRKLQAPGRILPVILELSSWGLLHPAAATTRPGETTSQTQLTPRQTPTPREEAKSPKPRQLVTEREKGENRGHLLFLPCFIFLWSAVDREREKNKTERRLDGDSNNKSIYDTSVQF